MGDPEGRLVGCKGGWVLLWACVWDEADADGDEDDDKCWECWVCVLRAGWYGAEPGPLGEGEPAPRTGTCGRDGLFDS